MGKEDMRAFEKPVKPMEITVYGIQEQNFLNARLAKAGKGWEGLSTGKFDYNPKKQKLYNGFRAEVLDISPATAKKLDLPLPDNVTYLEKGGGNKFSLKNFTSFDIGGGVRVSPEVKPEIRAALSGEFKGRAGFSFDKKI